MQTLINAWKNNKSTRIAIIVIAGFLVIGCFACVAIGGLSGGEAEEAPTTLDVTTTPDNATEPSEPTNTPAPTSTPTETVVPTQTPTPEPTNTPQPTDTPEPTQTPLPVQEFSGSGSAVVDLDPAGIPSIACIAGNQAARHFAVESIDSNNETVDLLVNTTDPYEGCRPLDWRRNENSVRLSIDAVGEWSIEILPIQPSAEFMERFRVEIPGTFSGTGDTILLLSGSGDPDIAKIAANEDARHFAVTAWSTNTTDLLVNTTDPYDGTVILDPETTFLEIDAESPWEITVETK